jgi:hypothetical protein
MSISVPNLAAFVFVYGVIVSVHELGHYSVGRWLAGIPADDIQIVLLDFPQHVALRDEGDWVSPLEQPRYSQIYSRYDTESTQWQYIDLYTAGGLIAQALGVIVIGGLLLAAAERSWAELFLELSLLLSVSYLILDIGSSRNSSRRQGYTGDFSALWRYSPTGAIATVLFFLLMHGILYIFL